MGKRTSWLDDDGGVAIDEMAQKLEGFVAAMADGVVSGREVDEQEKRVADAMRAVEPKLDDATHAKVTALLCEMTALAIMQVLQGLQGARTKAVFRG